MNSSPSPATTITTITPAGCAALADVTAPTYDASSEATPPSTPGSGTRMLIILSRRRTLVSSLSYATAIDHGVNASSQSIIEH